MCTTVTSVTLLEKMRGGNEEAWQRFCARYEPVILSLARRAGLQEDDARDVAQETLVAFIEAFRRGKYDRDRGQLAPTFRASPSASCRRPGGSENAPRFNSPTAPARRPPMDRFPDEGTLTGIFLREEQASLAGRGPRRDSREGRS